MHTHTIESCEYYATRFTIFGNPCFELEVDKKNDSPLKHFAITHFLAVNAIRNSASSGGSSVSTAGAGAAGAAGAARAAGVSAAGAGTTGTIGAVARSGTGVASAGSVTRSVAVPCSAECIQWAKAGFCTHSTYSFYMAQKCACACGGK